MAAMPAYASVAILDTGLTRHSTPCRLVFTGSSTTAGSGASTKSARYVDQVVAAIQRAFPSGTGVEQPVIDSTSAEFGTLSTLPGVHGYNAGEGGTTSLTYITETEAERIAALAPVAVFHSIGSNDYAATSRTAAECKAAVEAAIALIDGELTAPCVHIILHQQLRQDAGAPGAHASTWAQFGAALKEIADGNPTRVMFIDASEAFETVDCFLGDPYGVGKTDNIHLTNLGHALFARTVLRGLGIAQHGPEFLPGQRIATMAPRVSPVGSSSDYITDKTETDMVTAYLIKDHTYKVQWLPFLRASLAEGNFQLCLWKDTSLSGTQLQIGRIHTVGMTPGINGSAVLAIDHVATATGEVTFIGTMQRSSGNAGGIAHASAANPVQMWVEYVRGPQA